MVDIPIKIVEVDVPGLVFGVVSNAGIVARFGDKIIALNGDEFRKLKARVRHELGRTFEGDRHEGNNDGR